MDESQDQGVEGDIKFWLNVATQYLFTRFLYEHCGPTLTGLITPMLKVISITNLWLIGWWEKNCEKKSTAEVEVEILHPQPRSCTQAAAAELLSRVHEHVTCQTTVYEASSHSLINVT